MTSRPCSSRATAPVGSRDVAASVAVSRPRHCNQTWARTPSNVRGPSASHRTGCGLARQLRVLPRPQNASSRGPRAFPAAKKGRAGLFRNYYEFLVPKRCYPQNVRRPPMRAAAGWVAYVWADGRFQMVAHRAVQLHGATNAFLREMVALEMALQFLSEHL